jgi:hypothetical protein
LKSILATLGLCLIIEMRGQLNQFIQLVLGWSFDPLKPRGSLEKKSYRNIVIGVLTTL